MVKLNRKYEGFNLEDLNDCLVMGKRKSSGRGKGGGKYTTAFSLSRLVMCRLRPEGRSRAKPSQKKPGQAGPDLWPETAFGPAWTLGKPKPLAWAPACAQKLSTL
jgi:hypothetical protein